MNRMLVILPLTLAASLVLADESKTEKAEVHVSKSESTGKDIAVATPGKDSTVVERDAGKSASGKDVTEVDFSKGDFKDTDAGPKGEIKGAKESESTVTRDDDSD